MNKFISLIIFVSIFSFGFCQTALGIAQLTQPIVFKDILRGQEVTAVLKLINTEYKTVTYQLVAEGDIASWASFYKTDYKNLQSPITKIEVPPRSDIDATIKFIVPDDVPNGEYTGLSTIMIAPETTSKTDGTSASVFQKVGRQVSITVTDEELVKLETDIIPVSYDVEKGEPLQIKIVHRNLGNVSIRPDVKLKIVKISGDEKMVLETVYNAILLYPEDEEPIGARAEKTMPLVEWQTAGQPGSKYRAELEILLDGKVVKQHSFRFTIGFGSAEYLATVTVKRDNPLYWIIGGIFLVLAAVLIFLFLLKRWTKKRSDAGGNRLS
ncbi:MAG: hypothetical protein AAB906_01860 [Patescibacteria group bacterium]